jgi:hypothetical protein
MVNAFRVGQGCVLASPAFERLARPTVVDGRRAPALRLGDLRSWPWSARCARGRHVVAGFTNRSLRAQVTILRPLAAANDPPAPLALRQALRLIDRHVNDYIAEARMTA